MSNGPKIIAYNVNLYLINKVSKGLSDSCMSMCQSSCTENKNVWEQEKWQIWERRHNAAVSLALETQGICAKALHSCSSQALEVRAAWSWHGLQNPRVPCHELSWAQANKLIRMFNRNSLTSVRVGLESPHRNRGKKSQPGAVSARQSFPPGLLHTPLRTANKADTGQGTHKAILFHMQPRPLTTGGDLQTWLGGWREGSACKGIGGSRRGPGFGSQHPQSSSQLS